jgi:hypothetical protein
MPIPTRLAYDGWWLCERPAAALICNFPLPTGGATMTDIITPASGAGSAQEGTFAVKAAVVFAFAALADWLFYGHGIGISAVIFAVALACGSLLANIATVNQKQVPLAGALLLAGLVPAVEEFNAASLIFMVLALGIGLLLTTHRDQHHLGERAAALCDLYLVGPFRFLRDAIGAFNLPALKTGFAVWFIPVALGGVFVFLLVSANPLLEKWIRLLNPGSTASYISLGRVLFWALALSLVWPFIQVRWRGKREIPAGLAEAAALAQAVPSGRSNFFGLATITDPVQPAVRRSDRPRCRLSLGQRNPARRYQLRFLCASRRLSAHCHGAIGRGLRSGRHEARRSGRAISGDPAAGLSVGGAKRPARAVIDFAARSLR